LGHETFLLIITPTYARDMYVRYSDTV